MTGNTTSAQSRVGEALARTRLVDRGEGIAEDVGNPANDADGRACEALDLRFTLMHFAEHGLGAAAAARHNAQAAHEAGKPGQYAMWLAVCRSFDAGMANALERELAPSIATANHLQR